MTDGPGTDVIQLRGLRLLAICGALPEEQDRAQPFDFDIDVQVDLAPAGASDDLGDTVDYGALCARIEDVVTHGRFVLLERMAQVVAELVLSDDRVAATTVEVHKVRPPVAHALDTSGVRITRSRR